MKHGAQIQNTLSVLRETLDLGLRAMSRAMGFKDVGSYSGLESEGRGTSEDYMRPHVIALVAVLEIPGPDEERWVERIMGFLFGREAAPWDGDPPRWRPGCDPRKKPGRKSGLAWNSRERHAKAMTSTIDRLHDWAAKLLSLEMHEDPTVRYGMFLAMNLYDLAHEHATIETEADLETAEDEHREFAGLVKAARKKIKRAPDPSGDSRRTPCWQQLDAA